MLNDKAVMKKSATEIPQASVISVESGLKAFLAERRIAEKEMKKLLMALVVAAPVAFGLGAVNGAEAKTQVNIYLGVPHYSYQVGPDYVFRKGHGWYRPGRHMNRLSCNEARRIVRNRGYNNIVARNCSGGTYVFRAVRNHRVAIIYVNARTGAVWRG